MKKLFVVLVGLVFYPAVASAGVISIDLSGTEPVPSTFTLISAPGGSFAQTFVGQTVAGDGKGITGTPTPDDPLTLAPSGELFVEFFDPPGALPAGKSIFPLLDGQAPLSILLDQLADSITWTMGFGDSASPIKVLLFDFDGNTVNSMDIPILGGYNIYTLSGLGTFGGLSFFDNNDPAGLRFMNFSYTTVATVPEPSTLALFATGLALLLAFVARRRRPIRLEAA